MDETDLQASRTLSGGTFNSTVFTCVVTDPPSLAASWANPSLDNCLLSFDGVGRPSRDQLQDTPDYRFRPWRTSRNEQVHWDYRVDAASRVVAFLVHSAAETACPDRDHVPRLGHLLIDGLEAVPH